MLHALYNNFNSFLIFLHDFSFLRHLCVILIWSNYNLLCSTVFDQGQKVQGSEINEQISNNRRSDKAEIVQDEEVLTVASADDLVALSEKNSDQCKNNFAVSYKLDMEYIHCKNISLLWLCE